MRKITILAFSILCLISLCVSLAGCKWFGRKPDPDVDPNPGVSTNKTLINGGFESADLSGWTVEYGDAFDDDCVSSQKTFMFDNDANNNVLSIKQTGNWYLTGKGYHGKYSGARTGAIRSTNFNVPEDGSISIKLAGGSLTVGKGTGAPEKAKEKLCYVGFYLAENDQLIAMQTNEYFHEHTEEYIITERYESGVYNTDNFYEYYLDLSEYAGEEIYIRIVDNDESYYYGYIAVDDIRVGSDAEAQTEGVFFTKVVDYETNNGKVFRPSLTQRRCP